MTSEARLLPAWQVQIGHPDCQPWYEWYRASSADAALVRARRAHAQLLDDGGGVGPAYGDDGRLVEPYTSISALSHS